jgi:hypothetical protein
MSFTWRSTTAGRADCMAAARRVTHETGHRRGKRPLPAHIAEEQRPRLAADARNVVEVATDAETVEGRVVAAGDVDVRNVGRHRRKQTPLERVGDRRVLLGSPLRFELCRLRFGPRLDRGCECPLSLVQHRPLGGDVFDHPDVGDKLALGVEERPSPTVCPEDRPVGPHDAMLGLVPSPCPHRLRHDGRRRGAVIGMDEAAVHVDAAVEDPRRQTVDLLQRLVPHHAADRDVPFPRTEPAGFERQTEMIAEVLGRGRAHRRCGSTPVLISGFRARGLASQDWSTRQSTRCRAPGVECPLNWAFGWAVRESNRRPLARH